MNIRLSCSTSMRWCDREHCVEQSGTPYPYSPASLSSLCNSFKHFYEVMTTNASRIVMHLAISPRKYNLPGVYPASELQFLQFTSWSSVVRDAENFNQSSTLERTGGEMSIESNVRNESYSNSICWFAVKVKQNVFIRSQFQIVMLCSAPS